MKLSTSKFNNWKYILLSFGITFVCLLFLRLICTLTFNGTYSMLYSDCYHQYYPFFKAFRSALVSGESLLYSWNVGLGMDYLGLISYYLASPLNLISAILPESWMLGYFSFLMPLKLGLAGLFFAIFLKKVFCKNDLSISLFGTFYALCAWALGYQWNIMWLDTFALLPLVVLGMISLIKERKFVLYTLTLFLSIWSNYYIGLFTCIFIFLSFFIYQICRWESFKKFITDILCIALFSIIAIGMTALLSIPTLAALQTTQSSINSFPEGFKLNIADEDTWKGLLDAMRQVAGNTSAGIAPTYKEGLPNLYCGVGTNLLAILFLTSKKIRLRDRICTVTLLIFFILSFIIRQLDYIWHGFHFTNMIPYRFSFLYSFVLLYMAYHAWLLRKTFRLWQITTAGIVNIAFVTCSEEFKSFWDLLSGSKALTTWSGNENIISNITIISSSVDFVAINALLIFTFLFALYLGRQTKPSGKSDRAKKAWLLRLNLKRKLTTMICLATMALEITLLLTTFGTSYSGTNISNYPKGTSDTENAINYMCNQEYGTPFFRAETTHSQTLNDGALNGYNGISTFTSSANVKITEFMRAMGFGAKNTYNRYTYEDGSPVANLFLNLKYMIERDKPIKTNPYFDDIFHSGDIHLLKNNAYLPLGFQTDAQILNTPFFDEKNPFELQNQLLSNATGISQKAWHMLGLNSLTINGNDLTLNSQNHTGYCTYETENQEGTITYRYTVNKDGFFSFHVNQTKKSNISVYHNNAKTKLFSESYSLPQTFAVGYVEIGDEIEIQFNCNSNEKGTIIIHAATLDEKVFRSCYDVLNSSVLNLTNFSTTQIAGEITCTQDCVLYTSIPQDGNWYATVDGVPVQTILIGDAMVGLNLPQGNHTIVFSYRNDAFTLGWKISLTCFIIFLACYIAMYQPQFRSKRGKYQK